MSELAAPRGFGDGPQPGKSASLALTVLVHFLLAVFLIYGIRWQTRPTEFSDVELYSAPPAIAPSVPPPPPVVRSEPKPEPKVEPRPEPKPEPKVEPKPEPKPEIALKDKRKPIEKPPTKEPPVNERPAKEPPKPQIKEAPKEKPKPDARDIERMRLDEELAKETARVAQQTRRATELSALDGELARVGEAKARAASNRALAAWVDKIKLKVGGNVIAPSGVDGNPEAIFAVSLLPDGGLIDVRLKKSSGNKALDEAIERAIRKSDPLPRPEDPAVFQRDLNLKIRPFPG